MFTYILCKHLYWLQGTILSSALQVFDPTKFLGFDVQVLFDTHHYQLTNGMQVLTRLCVHGSDGIETCPSRCFLYEMSWYESVFVNHIQVRVVSAPPVKKLLITAAPV